MSASSLNAALKRVVAAAVDRPRTVLVIAALLAVLAAASASRLRRSNSLGDLLGGQSDAATALQRIMDDFAVVDELLILVTDDDLAARPEPAESAARLLRFARELEAAVAASPEARSVCSRIQYGADAEVLDFARQRVIAAGLLYLDDAEFEAVRERLTPPAMKEQLRQNATMIGAPGPAAGALAKELLKDPLRLREFLAGRVLAQRSFVNTWGSGPEFISADGRSLLIRVSGVRPASDLAFCTRLTDDIRRIIGAVPGDGLRVELSGPYAIAAASAASIRADAISNIVWDAVSMQLLFLLAYRRYSSFLLVMLPVALGILMSFGLYALLGRPITPLTAVIAAMLAGLAADYCIHYLSHYDDARAESADLRGAVDRTVADIGLPLFATGITTVHGFLAIAFSGAKALRDFALLGAIGLLCALLASIFLLPALLRVTEGSSRAAGRDLRPRSARFSLCFVVDAIARRPRLSIGLAGAALLGMTAFTVVHPLPRAETDLSVMHPRPNQPLQTQRRIVELFGGIADPLLILFTADTADGLLARAHAIERALTSPEAAAVGVSGVFSPASLLPDPSSRLHRAARSSALDAGRIAADFAAALDDSPFERSAYSDYTAFLSSLISTVASPGLDDLRAYPRLAASVLPSGASTGSPAGRVEAIAYVFFDRPLDNREHRDRAVDTIRRLLASVPRTTLTGVTVVGYDVESLIRRDIPRVVAISAAAVLLTVIVLFRRPGDIALIFLPVWWSVAAVLVYMGVTGERINLANLVAMPLLMGICVDYGIFTVGIARAARWAGERESPAGEDSLTQRLGASGHAMLITSITTLIGFGTLITTGTPAIQSLGRLVAVGVGTCLIGTTFLLIPILILRYRRRRSAGRQEPAAVPVSQ